MKEELNKVELYEYHNHLSFDEMKTFYLKLNLLHLIKSRGVTVESIPDGFIITNYYKTKFTVLVYNDRYEVYVKEDPLTSYASFYFAQLMRTAIKEGLYC